MSAKLHTRNQQRIAFKAWPEPEMWARIIDIMGEDEPVVELLRHALSENLSAEDQLNREVDEILRGHLKEIQRDSVDYRRMFQMVKTKLARARNLVI